MISSGGMSHEDVVEGLCNAHVLARCTRADVVKDGVAAERGAPRAAARAAAARAAARAAAATDQLGSCAMRSAADAGTQPHGSHGGQGGGLLGESTLLHDGGIHLGAQLCELGRHRGEGARELLSKRRVGAGAPACVCLCVCPHEGCAT